MWTVESVLQDVGLDAFLDQVFGLTRACFGLVLVHISLGGVSFLGRSYGALAW